MKKTMAFLLLSLLGVVSGGVVYRELHVPAGELPLLLESWPSAVLLPQAEFVSLLARSRSVTDEPAPVGAVLTTGALEMTVEADRALLIWRGEAAVAGEGWQRLRLTSAGIAWSGVEGARQSLYVGKHEPDSLELLLSSGGEHIVLHGECRLERQGAESRLRFRLPDAAVQNWQVRAAGDVVIRSGARVLARGYDAGAQVTTFRLLPERGAVELVLSINDRRQQNERYMTAASQVDLAITEREELLQAETTFAIAHQPCATFAIRLPAGMEVMEVGGAEGGIAAWRQTPAGELQVELREPALGAVKVQVRARRPFLGRGWNFSDYHPLSCYVVRCRVAVRLSRHVQAEPVKADGVRWLELPAAEDAAEAVPWLAFQGLEGYRLQAALVPSPAELAVTLQADCFADEAGQRLQLELALTARGEPFFSAPLRLPAGWRPELAAVEGGELEHDGEGYRLLPAGGCPPGETRTMRLVFRHTPADWFSGWEAARPWAFPAIAMPGLRWRGGVQRLHVQGDLHGELTEVAGCRVTAVEASAAERLTEAVFAAEPGRLSWQLTLPPPRLAGESYSRFQVENDRLLLAHELVWQVSGSHVGQVAFRLPPGTPEAVALRGEPVEIRDFRSEIDADGWRRFLVHLSDRVMGELRIGVDYPQPVDWGAGKVCLPIPVLEGVPYQSGRLAVEGHPEYQVEISGAPRRIDAGEVAGLAARPGKRLLGCYAYLGTLPEVWVRAVRQEVAALPACLVQHCRIDTLVAANGRRQSTAEYQLRPNLNALHLRLPPQAVLWGVTLDGKPAVLLDKGGELWVQMSEGASGRLRRLQVSWENSGSDFSLFGQAERDRPELSYVAADGNPQAVPVADVHWQVYPPEGYRVLFAPGGAGALAPRPAAALVRWIYRCLGGIDPTKGFPGCMVLPALQAAREKARVASKLYADKIMVQESLPSASAAPAAFAGGGEGRTKGKAAGDEARRQELTVSGRSLQIQLGRMSGGLSWRNLGGAEKVRLVFVRASAWRALRRSLVLFFLLGAFWLRGTNWRRRLWFAGGTALASGLLPCLPGCGALAEILNPLFLLALVFPLACLLGDGLRCRLPRRCAVLGLLIVSAGELAAAPVATPFRPWEPRPLPLPADAVIFPYGVDGLPSGQVLVPRGLYEALRPEAAEPSRPADYAALPIVYRGALAGEGGLALQGSMAVQIFRAGAVLLPELPVSGVRLEAVEVDGRPATVWQEDGKLRLVLSGRGEHVVTLRLRCPVRKQGGWQVADLALPVLDGLGRLVLENVPAGLELLAVSASRSWSRAAAAAATAAVPLSLDGGELRLQWRPETSRSDRDTTLQVDSEMVLRLEAEAARLTWTAVFHFQDRGRTHFDLELPEDWRIEAVEGVAIRGWEYQDGRGEVAAADPLAVPGAGALTAARRRLRVHLSRPAADGERLTLELVSRRVERTAPPQRWNFPALTVPGVQRHRALVLARCLDGVEATAEFSFPLQRTDPGRKDRNDWEAWLSPGEPVPLAFVLSERPARPRAQLQLVQTLSEDGQELRGTWQLSREAGAWAGEIMLCPPGFVLETLAGDGVGGWNPTAHPEGPAIQVWFRDPSRLERKVSFSGRLAAGLVPDGRYPLACFRLSGYPEQRTVLAVQAPAGWQLREEECRGIESALPVVLESWLRQRQPVFLAFQARQAAYGGNVLATSAAPELSGTLVQTLRLTAQGLEQTVDGALHAAGRLSELSLLLPADWRGTVPEVAGLRSHLYTDWPGQPGWVRCQLQFALPVQGAFALRLQRWRLPASAGETIAFPRLPGKFQHFLFVENSGRDEIVVPDGTGLLPLRLRSGLPELLRDRLQAGKGQAWEAADGEVAAVVQVRPREEVATAGARIGLASTVMVLDTAGNCLVEQRLQMDNRTEQFLDLELPPGCRLLTARVAGDLVKPLLRPVSTPSPSRVTLPLVKTAEGDLDYEIVLICRAELPRPGWGGRWHLPLLVVRGISVERSQVELRLPRDLRWFALSGSFAAAVDFRSYANEHRQYYQRQVQRLNEALLSSNQYVQSRARQNARKIRSRSVAAEVPPSAEEREMLDRVGQLSVSPLPAGKPAEAKAETVVSRRQPPGRRAGMDGNERLEALPAPVSAPAQPMLALDADAATGSGAAVAANQAGLELPLPAPDAERWQTLFFTCPRSASELSLRVVPAGLVRSLQDLLWLLAVLAMVAGLASERGRAALGRVARPVGRRRVLAWAGILSVLLGVLPYLGGILLAGLAARRSWRKDRRRPPLPPPLPPA